jgi:molecular chaperone DnaJ
VEVAPSTTFQRDGQNLYYEKKISYLEAILGAETTIPTPEKEVRIKVKPGTQTNTAVRLKGFGFPHVHSKRRGDLYVVLKVEIPARLSSEEKDTLTNLKKNLRRS